MTTKELQLIVGADPDGDFGPKSVEAAKVWVDRVLGVFEELVDKFPASEPILRKAVPVPHEPLPDIPLEGEWHPRTEANLKTLSPKTQLLARQFLVKAAAMLPAGVEVRIIDGSRTYAEQDAIYLQGRTSLTAVNNARKAAGMSPIIAKDNVERTKARAGYSWHNFEMAWDVGVFLNGKYQPESIWYDKLGPVGESVGLEWGGRWTSPVDKPHYQLKSGFTLAQLRKRKEQGLPVA